MNNDQVLSNKLDPRSQDISFFEYLYVFVIIIYGGMASTFVRSFTFESPIALILLVILSIILILTSKVVFKKEIYVLILLLLIYLFASTVKYRTIHPVFIGVTLVYFINGYITVNALKYKLFIVFERFMYFLAIVGLVMWGIQLILGGDNLFNLIGKIPSIDKFSFVTGDGRNIILYSVQPSSFKAMSHSAIIRNCGFAWEPGGFAIYLCLAIFINLFFIKSERKLNKRFWILVAALLSTQSTTGYIILIIIIIFYFFQAHKKIVILFMPILLIGIGTLATLPFMKDKIIEYLEEVSIVDAIAEESIGIDVASTPQRFSSFVISLRDFKNNPVLGYGGHLEDRWFNKIRANLAPISGIGNLLAQFGIVGFLFFITMLIRSSRYFSCYFGYKGQYLFF